MLSYLNYNNSNNGSISDTTMYIHCGITKKVSSDYDCYTNFKSQKSVHIK